MRTSTAVILSVPPAALAASSKLWQACSRSGVLAMMAAIAVLGQATPQAVGAEQVDIAGGEGVDVDRGLDLRLRAQRPGHHVARGAMAAISSSVISGRAARISSISE